MNLRKEILEELLKVAHSKKIFLLEGVGRSLYELLFDIEKVAMMTARSAVNAADTELGRGLRSLFSTLTDQPKTLSQAEKTLLSSLSLSIKDINKLTREELENAVSQALFGIEKNKLNPTQLQALSKLDPKKLPKPVKTVAKTIAQQAEEFVNNNISTLMTDVGREYNTIEKTATNDIAFRQAISDLIKRKAVARGASEEIVDEVSDLVRARFASRIEQSSADIVAKVAKELQEAANAGKKNPIKEVAFRYATGIKNGEFIAGGRFQIAAVLGFLTSDEVSKYIPDFKNKEAILRVLSTIAVTLSPVVTPIQWSVLKVALGGKTSDSKSSSGSSGGGGGSSSDID